MGWDAFWGSVPFWGFMAGLVSLVATQIIPIIQNYLLHRQQLNHDKLVKHVSNQIGAAASEQSNNLQELREEFKEHVAADSVFQERILEELDAIKQTKLSGLTENTSLTKDTANRVEELGKKLDLLTGQS